VKVALEGYGMKRQQPNLTYYPAFAWRQGRIYGGEGLHETEIGSTYLTATLGSPKSRKVILYFYLL
jgi:hypothetical protein